MMGGGAAEGQPQMYMGEQTSQIEGEYMQSQSQGVSFVQDLPSNNNS